MYTAESHMGMDGGYLRVNKHTDGEGTHWMCGNKRIGIKCFSEGD